MKIHNITYYTLRALTACTMLLAGLFASTPLRAHDPAKYASSSVLSEGKWGKVKVTRPGMQFVSAATLRQLGFSDPTKVNVYGFGGRILPDELRASDPDDLPLLPSVRSAAGIWFFGHDHIRWSASSTSQGSLPYQHQAQPYADESWYYLSDRDATAAELPKAALPTSAGASANTFTQMLLHEQDLVHPHASGRIYLGEDFRSTPKRTFSFDLTDNAGDSFSFYASFGALSLNASEFTLSPSGGNPVKASIAKSSIGSTSSYNSDVYMRTGISSGAGKVSDNRAAIEVSYDPNGDVKFARLDYIELAYTRRLALRDNQIYFPIRLSQPTRLEISGASAGLTVWDVTDPTRPQSVEVSVNGSTATFIAPAGAREYVAFLPEKGGYAVADPKSVDNQDIHSMNTPDMLIISPYEYLSAANSLAAHHREHDGYTVHILQPETIYNEFSSGTPDPGAFRRLLKMWYDRGAAPAPDNGEPTGKIGYCLILSRPTYDNKRIMETTRNTPYPRIPIWQSPSGAENTSSYCTDDYIVMLDDYETTGSFKLSEQKLRVAVGRMPFKSQSEASAMVKKYIDYVCNQEPGAWHNQIMMVADNNDKGAFHHLTQSEDMYNLLCASDAGKRFQVEKLYLDSYEQVVTQKGPTFPAAKERLLRLWNDGVNLITYIGHASPIEWTDEKLLEWADIQNFSNRNLPFLYAATCEFARIDQDTPSGAEILWSNPNGGIIATICPVRSVYIKNNGPLSEAVGRHFFDNSTPGRGRRIGNILLDAKNDINDDNRLRFTIVGNPVMRFNLPENIVTVTSINGVDPATAEDKPVISARSRTEIKGEVTKADGTRDTEFNGTIDIVLYDAEKVVETYPYVNANGSQEKVSYNDHKTMLYHGLAKVTAGEWNTTLLVPMEIENLYTPGRISLYAYSDKGVEAHGGTTDLYVYGYDESAPDDNEGPQIHFFGLNREDFEEGTVVHTSPVAMAKVSDDSGINLSDSGIGHQITLTLDGRTYFSDVNSYYTPDTEDFTAGHIAYPLPTLEPGEHTLRLTVWDNANNSASAELTFNVAVSKQPEIYDLRTNVNPAREDVTFTLSTDRPMAQVDCQIEVFDLNGRRIWTSSRTGATDIQAAISVNWDLCTSEGQRVPRGIYLYRATVTSPEGTSATRSRKLAVTAQ